jgi:hypothetical protein
MAKFEMYQIVRVVRVPTRNDASFPLNGAQRLPKIGETGTVVEIYLSPHEAYCVESVAPDARPERLVDFLPEELEAV